MISFLYDNAENDKFQQLKRDSECGDSVIFREVIRSEMDHDSFDSIIQLCANRRRFLLLTALSVDPRFELTRSYDGTTFVSLLYLIFARAPTVESIELLTSRAEEEVLYSLSRFKLTDAISVNPHLNDLEKEKVKKSLQEMMSNGKIKEIIVIREDNRIKQLVRKYKKTEGNRKSVPSKSPS